MGSEASAFLDEAVSKGEHIGVSAITIVEIVYLMEKGRILGDALADLRGATLDEAAVLRCIALDERIAMKMMEVSECSGSGSPRPRNCGDGVAARRAYPQAGPSNYASGLQTIW